jgi:hypothetical protein
MQSQDQQNHSNTAKPQHTIRLTIRLPHFDEGDLSDNMPTTDAIDKEFKTGNDLFFCYFHHVAFHQDPELDPY